MESSRPSTHLIFEDPDAVLNNDHPAVKLLSNSHLVVKKKSETANVNKYLVSDERCNQAGYLATRELGSGIATPRQVGRKRPFMAHVFDRSMKEVLRVGSAFLG